MSLTILREKPNNTLHITHSTVQIERITMTMTLSSKIPDHVTQEYVVFEAL